jgi:hypothetical protein
MHLFLGTYLTFSEFNLTRASYVGCHQNLSASFRGSSMYGMKCNL